MAADDEELQGKFENLIDNRSNIFQSEQELRSIFENLDGAFFRIDRKGNLIMISPLFAEQFGYSDAGDIIGWNIRDNFFVNPKDYDEFYKHLEFTGKIRDERVILKRSDGSQIVVSVSCHQLRDPLGNPVGIEGIVHDISDLVRTEEALRKSEERFREMAERSSDLILILNKSMSPIYVSPSARTIIGYDPLELVGKPPDFAAETIFSQSGPDLFRAIGMTMNGIVVENVEIQVSRKDGTLIFVNISAVPTIHKGVVDGVQVSMRDITRAKTMEMALKESEEKYRRFAKNAQDLIYRMSIPERRFTYVNPASVALTGYTPEEFYADPNLIRTLIHPSMQDYFNEKREKFQNLVISPVNEFSIIDRSGTIRWLHHRKTLVTDENGNAIALEGILTDVTNYKNIESELRKSEQRFLAAALNTRSFVFEVNPEGLLTYASFAIEDILGYLPEEAVGKIRCFDFLDPSVREDLKIAVMDIFQSYESFSDLEAMSRHKNGSSIVMRVSGTPVFDGEGTCTGYCGISQDITKEKEAEKKLVESEARYRLLADNVHDIIWTADEHLHFTYVSPSITEFLGITPKEAIEEPFIDFLTPESVQEFSLYKRQLVDSIQKGVQFPRKTELNLEFKHKNGSTVWTEILITIVYDSNKKFCGIVGVTRDINRRRQAEMALMKANRQLSLLSGITRHDILNKITTILGFLFLSRETKPSPDTSAYLKRIEYATNEIKVLIEFTRYFENLGSSKPTWQNLTAILGQINFPKHLIIDTNLENYSILADPMLEKVFFNLLDNSLRHGETVSKIRVFTHKNEDSLIVIWEDNGIGIANEDKEFIFERGFGKNTGLGMFLVREILSLTDISITENGKPGTGARFEISVPKGMYKKPDA